MQSIEESAKGVKLRVLVAPRSSSNVVQGEHNDEIKIALTAPPVEGAANKALLEFLSKMLGVSKTNLSVVSGETSRHKVVLASGISAAVARQKLLEKTRDTHG